jgi:hypothetical protein
MTAYANFKQVSLRYDLERHVFDCWYVPQNRVVENAGITQVRLAERVFSLRDYTGVTFEYAQPDSATRLTITYTGGPVEQTEFRIHFLLDDRGIRCSFGCRGDLDVHLEGVLRWGGDMEHETFAVNLDRQGMDLRCAHGPASSIVDHALFDRRTDSALEISGCYTTRIQFDWELKAYRFRVNTEGQDYNKGFTIRTHEQVYARKFNIAYNPINPRTTFADPPVGWMSWYAVQFDASEDTVLENARWQAAHLRDYGANTIWVDWEWYHSDFSGVGQPGVDTFCPDARMYPNGLAHVAAEIKKLGFIPAVWIGATNDPSENEFIRDHPETVLVQKPQWCGQYFMDLTHPLYLEEFIPKVLGQILDWGYQALKWDCMPVTMQLSDQYHDRFYNPALSTEQALMAVVAAARKVVGPDFYMLYCSGLNLRDLNIAAAGFDAARIGGDIFSWDDFISQCIGQVMKMYAFHNVVFANDPDNVILRSKFNTYDQALSRLSFVSLLGLPVTLGDNLPELPPERVELLRRGIPSLTTHPMDIRVTAHDLRVVKANLAVNKPYGQWNVVDVFNLLAEEMEVAVDLRADLHLPLEEGPYLVYDYWNRQYIGEISTCFNAALRPFASRVFAVHKKLSRPQVLSTSRHLSQGAVDLVNLVWDEQRQTLSGISQGVAGDAYEIVLHLPDEYRMISDEFSALAPEIRQIAPNVWGLVFAPAATGEFPWSVAFNPV